MNNQETNDRTASQKNEKELRSAASMPESILKSDRITPKDYCPGFRPRRKKGSRLF